MSAADPSTTPEQLVTAEELFSSPEPEGSRRELIAGAVVHRSFRSIRNGAACSQINRVLYESIPTTQCGVVLGPGCGFVIERDPDTVLAPAAAYVDQSRWEKRPSKDFYFLGPPTLAVEVISPGESGKEAYKRMKMWSEAGCKAVWMLWLEGQSVTDYRSLDDIRFLKGDQMLDVGDVIPGFLVKVSDLFAG